MYKRVLISIGIGIFALLVLNNTPVLSVLFTFLVMGIVPGMNVTIPFWVMLIAYPTLFFAVLYWLGTRQPFIPEVQTATKKATTKKRTTSRKKSAATTQRKRATPKRQQRTAV